MLPDRVSNPGPLTYESDALPIALRSPARDSPVNFTYIFPGIQFQQPQPLLPQVVDIQDN